MWDKITPLLPEFPDAILNAMDATGQPFSVRCQPQANGEHFSITPQPVELTPGAASLLFHVQGAYINELKSFLLRGTLAIDAQRWVFTPTAFVPGVGIGNIFSQINYLRRGKRTAKRYFEKRGLPYPTPDWDVIEGGDAS